jgi:hypothetical protein
MKISPEMTGRLIGYAILAFLILVVPYLIVAVALWDFNLAWWQRQDRQAMLMMQIGTAFGLYIRGAIAASRTVPETADDFRS